MLWTGDRDGEPGGLARVLFYAQQPDGELLQVVQYPDGTLDILSNGQSLTGHRWAAGEVERCVSSYYRLIAGPETGAGAGRAHFRFH